MIVDEAHAVLPEIARDQYWHDLEIQLPYTLATQQTRRDDYTATADNIESVTHWRRQGGGANGETWGRGDDVERQRRECRAAI